MKKYTIWRYSKVNSVQEAYAKCFAVHILKIRILQITWNKRNKQHQTLSFQFLTNRFNILMFFVLFFHAGCKISNLNKWTTKHLLQASCIELTLKVIWFIFFKDWVKTKIPPEIFSPLTKANKKESVSVLIDWAKQTSMIKLKIFLESS